MQDSESSCVTELKEDFAKKFTLDLKRSYQHPGELHNSNLFFIFMESFVYDNSDQYKTILWLQNGN